VEIEALPVATLADWAGLSGAVVASIGVLLVVLQLRSGAAVTRAQATIQFQQAFRGSSSQRYYLMTKFPVHEDLLLRLAEPTATAKFRTWRTLDELDEEDKKNARAVVAAMNDVAQYVSDGLSLRSALQQYHTIFVRAGVLLWPFLDQLNEQKGGQRQVRWGRRVMDLYNAGIDYHHLHPKHQGRALTLERPAVDGSGTVSLKLLDVDGSGIEKHPGFGDEVEGSIVDELRMRRAVRAAEARLRP